MTPTAAASSTEPADPSAALPPDSPGTVESAPAPAPAVLPTVADLPGHVEAVLLSSARPTPAERLARAVGLAPPLAEDEAEPDDARAEAAPPAEPPADDAKPTRRNARAQRAATERTVQLAAAVDAVAQAVAQLNQQYDSTGRSFRIEHVSGGYRVMTLPRFAPSIQALARERQQTRLTRAAVETLAIIAYKQPITRAQLEAIRGVACGEVLRSLMERRLITIKGRAEELGRPILYGTSRQFLDYFGLASITDLPQVAELKVGTP